MLCINYQDNNISMEKFYGVICIGREQKKMASFFIAYIHSFKEEDYNITPKNMLRQQGSLDSLTEYDSGVRIRLRSTESVLSVCY